MPRNKLWKWVSSYLKNYAFLTSISNAAFSRIFRSSWYRRTWPKKICLIFVWKKSRSFLSLRGFLSSGGTALKWWGYPKFSQSLGHATIFPSATINENESESHEFRRPTVPASKPQSSRHIWETWSSFRNDWIYRQCIQWRNLQPSWNQARNVWTLP